MSLSSDIGEACKVCSNDVIKLARCIMENDKFANEDIGAWKVKLLLIGKDLALLQKDVQITTDVLNHLKRDVDNSEGSEQEINKRVRKLVNDQLALTDPAKLDLVTRLQGFLKVENDFVGDDEIELMDTGLKESDFTCPFNAGKMKIPMKNAGCKHHVDKTSFAAMVQHAKGGIPICPVPGCTAKWQKNSVSEDEDFLFEMERFFRTKQNESCSQPMSQSNTYVLDA